MSITKFPPNTILLGGKPTQVNDLAAGEAITPGMLIERYNSSGTGLWRKHTTAAGPCHAVATELSMINAGLSVAGAVALAIDQAYAANDLLEAAIVGPGDTFLGIIPSGQTIVIGDKLESAGTGKLRAYTNSPTPFVALEAKTALADTRIRVEVI